MAWLAHSSVHKPDNAAARWSAGWAERAADRQRAKPQPRAGATASDANSTGVAGHTAGSATSTRQAKPAAKSMRGTAGRHVRCSIGRRAKGPAAKEAHHTVLKTNTNNSRNLCARNNRQRQRRYRVVSPREVLAGFSPIMYFKRLKLMCLRGPRGFHHHKTS